VDPERRRAWVGGGALLGDLDRATQQFGLATTAGNVSDTGVGGLTLGGGMGWLARMLGLACDNVVRFEVVTAGGDILTATESENPDLYWGLRGGGGNFGVVTEFEFNLHEVGTTAMIAELFYAVDDAPRILARWRELLEESPRQATLTAWAGSSGVWPILPSAHHNRPLLSVGYVWVGDPEEGRNLLPAFHGAGRPVAESAQEVSYLDLQTMDDVRQRQRMRRYWKGHFVRELGEAAAEAFVARGDAGELADPTLLPYGGLLGYGGAIGEVGMGDTAFSHRDALVEFVTVSHWADAGEDELRISASRAYGAAMEPFASGVYVNALGDEGQAGVRRAYDREKLARLVALKDHYDPENVFHLNHNIRPSGR
jgi:FAD/FMN-containing dehydrogenase